MAGSIFTDTLRTLEKVAERTPEIAVAFSGGKDSLAVASLCLKVFPTVRAFFMFTAPGLEVCEKQIRWAREAWNLPVVQFLDWRIINAMKVGLWCDAPDQLDDIPEPTLKDGYAMGLQYTGCEMLADGMKDADGLKRRQFFANCRDGGNPFWERVIHPIREWRKKDVLDYLRVNKIPIPDSEAGAITTGVGLNHDSLCWLHDKHPADFQRLLKWFPYAEACIYRRKWFGVE